MKKQIFLVILLIIAATGLTFDVQAQCSMCQAVVESNMQGNEKSFGLGLNNGILYLMIVPYLLLGVVGFMFYKKLKGNN